MRILLNNSESQSTGNLFFEAKASKVMLMAIDIASWPFSSCWRWLTCITYLKEPATLCSFFYLSLSVWLAFWCGSLLSQERKTALEISNGFEWGCLLSSMSNPMIRWCFNWSTDWSTSVTLFSDFLDGWTSFYQMEVFLKGTLWWAVLYSVSENAICKNILNLFVRVKEFLI